MLTDHSTQPNFSVGYSVMKSDAVIHLVQWQYWWWFWFAFLWGFYYLTVTRIVKGRVLKFRPRMYTSYRSHGKWGDFLACTVPALWCFNILVNSSFILRMLEWQNESSLFTVRIRGRQWYWVYKLELRHLLDIESAPRSVGRRKWVVNSGDLHIMSDSYLMAIKKRAESTWLTKYWAESVVSQTFAKLPTSTVFDSAGEIYNDTAEAFKLIYPELNYGELMWRRLQITKFYRYPLVDNLIFSEHNMPGEVESQDLFSSLRFKAMLQKNVLSNLVLRHSSNIGANTLEAPFADAVPPFVGHDLKRVTLFEQNRIVRRLKDVVEPVLVTKPVIFRNSFNPSTHEFIDIKFNGVRSVSKKLDPLQSFFVIKQKRYRLKQFVPVRVKLYRTELGIPTGTPHQIDSPVLGNFTIVRESDAIPTSAYGLFKKNKSQSEVFDAQVARRLLRTRKTLVLPAHVNLTFITNSYDVIHSWFIPMLGLKMDCVPGRSTHHSFYSDNIGFFYGQCAEICGRYHHHMPIRICLLPYEQFFIWWQHFGLPKILNTVNKNKVEGSYGRRAFTW